MIDQFDLWNRFCSDNNTFQGGTVRPERDFERMVNSFSQDAWNEWTAMAEKTQEIDDNLSPFLKSVNVIVGAGSGNYGVAAYPKDYGRYSVARVLVHKEECLCEPNKDIYQDGVCKVETELEKQERIEKYKNDITENLITKVESSKWASMLEHKKKCPTLEAPGLTQLDNGFKVAPRQISVVVLDYYVKPKYAKFIFTVATGNPQTGAGDYLVYDATKSDKLEWPETFIPYLLDKLRVWYSKYTRDGQLFQMSK